MKHKKIILSVLIFLTLFLLPSSVSVYAEEEQDEIEDKQEENDTNHGTMNEDIALDRNAKIKTSDFITTALYSLDSETAEKEAKEDYIENFMNSSSTAVAYSISLVDPETIIIWLLKFVITFIEIIGTGLTLIVMLIYNIASSDVLGQVINSVFDGINSVLFDWSNANSYIYKILFLLGILMIVKKLIDKRKEITIKKFVGIIVSTVASCMFVVFIGMYGRPVLNNLNTQLQASMVTTFAFGEEGDTKTPIEIQNKRLLFENLQMKSFRLRHFGVTETEQIAAPDPNGYKDNYLLGQLALEQWESGELTAQQRVDALLDDPGVSTAKVERQSYGSTQVAYSAAQSFQILTLSVVFIIHRVFLAIIFGACSLLVLLTSVMATLMIAVITYRTMAALLGGGKAQLYAILNCAQWMLLATIANVLFSALLFALSHIVGMISSFGIILLIPVDVLMFFGGKAFVHRLPAMLERIKESLINEDGNISGTFKGVLTGETSVTDIYDNYQKTSGLSKKNDDESTLDDEEHTSMNDIDESDKLLDEEIDIDDDVEKINTEEENKEISDDSKEDSFLEKSLTGKKDESEQEEDQNEKDAIDTVQHRNDVTSVQDVIDNEQVEEDSGYEISDDMLPKINKSTYKKENELISMTDIAEDSEEVKQEMDMLESQDAMNEELKFLDEDNY